MYPMRDSHLPLARLCMCCAFNAVAIRCVLACVPSGSTWAAPDRNDYNSIAIINGRTVERLVADCRRQQLVARAFTMANSGSIARLAESGGDGCLRFSGAVLPGAQRPSSPAWARRRLPVVIRSLSLSLSFCGRSSFLGCLGYDKRMPGRLGRSFAFLGRGGGTRCAPPFGWTRSPLLWMFADAGPAPPLQRPRRRGSKTWSGGTRRAEQLSPTGCARRPCGFAGMILRRRIGGASPRVQRVRARAPLCGVWSVLVCSGPERSSQAILMLRVQRAGNARLSCDLHPARCITALGEGAAGFNTTHRRSIASSPHHPCRFSAPHPLRPDPQDTRLRTLKFFTSFALPWAAENMNAIERMFESEFDYTLERRNLEVIRERLLPRWGRRVCVPKTFADFSTSKVPLGVSSDFD